MALLKRCHPIIFSLGPILFLYARNSRELALSALPLPLLGALALALLVWGGCRLVQQDRHRAALMASAVLLPFFSYGALYQSTHIWRALIPQWPYLFFAIWLAAVAVLVIVLARARYPRELLSDGVTVTAAVFLFIVLFSIGQTELKRNRRPDALDADVRVAAAAIPREKLPNIYYIILDSYGREDMLASYFKFNNRAFIEALKARGFYVAGRSRTNYCQTITSIPSSLNFSYLDKVAQEQGNRASDRQPLGKMIQHAAVCRVLKQYGYRIVAFPSEYLPINMPSDVPMQQVSGYTDFHFSVLDSTPLLLLSLKSGSILDYYAYHRRMICWQITRVPKTGKLPGPLFVFAHIMAPHLPYVFDEDGNPIKGDPIAAEQRRRTQWSHGEESEGNAHMYCDELIYLNKLVLGMLDQIKQNATRPTVIVVQADHGPGQLPDTMDEFTMLDPLLRFSILNAYYFPGGPPPAITPDITPVNTFRVIFNTYLKTDYPLLKNEQYFSPFTYPYDMRRMTEELKAAGP